VLDVAVLAVLALISRAWGTWFDHAHFDEWAAVSQSRVLLETGELPVHMYGPGVTIWAVLPEWLARRLDAAPPVRFALHRIWEGAIPGALSILLLWYITLRLTAVRWVAFVAGLLLVCAFVHFEASHYAKADMLALSLLLSPLALVASRQGGAAGRGIDGSAHLPGPGFAIVAGVFAGVTVACRPNMAVFLPVWPIYFLFAIRPFRMRRLLVRLAVFVPAVGLGWMALHLVCLKTVDGSVPKLLAHVVREAMVAKYTYPTLCQRPWWYYFAPFGHDLPALGVGRPILLAAAAGLLLGRVHPPQRALWRTLLVMAGLYLLFLCTERVRLIRWAGPLAPLLCLFAALALHRGHAVLAGLGCRRRAAGVLVAGLLLVMLAQPVRQMVLFDRSAGETPTTLTAARQWMAARPQARYKVFGCFGWGPLEAEYPYHYPAAPFERELARVRGLMEWIGARTGVSADWPDPLPTPDPRQIIGPLELMRRDRLDYIVVGGWRHDFLVHTPEGYAHDADIRRRLLAFAAEARRKLVLCTRFAPRCGSGWGMTFMGRQQTLEVYALPPGLRPDPTPAPQHAAAPVLPWPGFVRAR